MIRSAILSVALLSTMPAAAATRPATPLAAAEAYFAAQRAFDPAALADVTMPDFVEISPVGEVDPRAKVLGFYAPAERRGTPPAMTLSEQSVRSFGDTAIVTARVSFGPGAVRAVYVACKDKGRWALVSAQYTPIRGPKPA
ncbi:MAG: nuclear transport factor 2 family protein [Pseudomonadota bacterium]